MYIHNTSLVCVCVCVCVCVQVFQESTLNGFMSLGRAAWTEARHVLQRILSKDEVHVLVCYTCTCMCITSNIKLTYT